MGKGKGVFFQWDGEARFAFRPDGGPFSIFIRQVFTVPVVIGPDTSQEKFRGNLDNGEPVRFAFRGDTTDDIEAVKRRVLKSVRGELTGELHATEEDFGKCDFRTPTLVE